MSPTSTERILTSGLMMNVKRVQSVVTASAGDGVDADSIPSRSPKGALGDTGKRNDFEVASWFCEMKDHRTVEVVSLVPETTQGVSAVVVRVPGASVGMAGEKDLVVKGAFRDTKKSDVGITYHEGNGTKLEFERSNGVFELMIERPRSSGKGGAAKVIGAGNVESLQRERSWNLSRLM